MSSEDMPPVDVRENLQRNVTEADMIITQLPVRDSHKIALKIMGMLALRADGALDERADDFISGLVCAYGIVVGIVNDADGALRAVKAELFTTAPSKEG